MIAIIMATYNGALYLRQQIDSILQNSENSFHLYICDDNSTDDTPNIITEYAERFPQKIFPRLYRQSAGGACESFFRAMGDIPQNYEYYMLSDQDDVWMEDKIAVTLQAMVKKETENADLPVLVHTDLQVVDADLKTIAPSMAAYQNISHERILLKNLLVQNTVTGCTAMMNRKLFSMVGEKPQRCAMHDWWIALIASAFGSIVYLDRPTILYRQHGDNSVGAKQARGMGFYINKWRTRKTVKKNYQDTFSQAEALLERFGDNLSGEDRKMIADYAAIPQKSKIGKWRVICRYKLYKNTPQRTLGQFLSI